MQENLKELLGLNHVSLEKVKSRGHLPSNTALQLLYPPIANLSASATQNIQAAQETLKVGEAIMEAGQVCHLGFGVKCIGAQVLGLCDEVKHLTCPSIQLPPVILGK